MKPAHTAPANASTTALDRALQRILAEIQDGLRHGYFEFTLTCDIVGGGRRRLMLRAGKNHQFLIAECDCLPSAGSNVDSRDGSDSDAA